MGVVVQWRPWSRIQLLVAVLVVVTVASCAAPAGAISPLTPEEQRTQKHYPYHEHHHHNHSPQPRLKTPRPNLEPVFQWKHIEYADLPAETRDSNESYIQYNNLPLGIAHYKDRLFVTIPRRKPGIPSTLNYASFSDKPSPALKSFPDYETNRLGSLEKGDLASPDRIISVYRPRVDYACDRLWFIDTGLLEYGDNLQVQPPSLWIVDLLTGKRVHRFEVPTSIVTSGIGMASLTIDSEAGRCESAFAYIPDFFHSRLHVFSLAENRMWSFVHAYFHIDPLYGDFKVAGQRYQWRDGIFSITLAPKTADGNRIAMFHAMSSLNEFTVSTAVLKNSTMAARSFHGDDFELLGRRQEMGQSAMHGYDPTTGVVFYAEVGRNSVGCWNSKRRFNALTHDILFRDDENMIYPSDLTVNSEGSVWVMSNTMPRFIYSRLNATEFSYKIWRGRTSEMIRGSGCE